MASVNEDPSTSRMSSSSNRSRDSRRQNVSAPQASEPPRRRNNSRSHYSRPVVTDDGNEQPQQQLSQIEKSVTHLLVATKQLLETLTHWSRGTATEGEVSDVYVRLGYEFNIACRTFNAIGVETNDLGPVPDLLRSILEETLSQEASQSSLERYLPRIRDIVINLLHGLKAKQERLRQKSKKDRSLTSGPGRTESVQNGGAEEQGPPVPARQSSGRNSDQRRPSGDIAEAPELPPRTSSVASGGRASPTRVNSSGRMSTGRSTPPNRDMVPSDSGSSLSSTTAQNLPVIAPYPQEETMPGPPTIKEPPQPYNVADFPHPPPPPPKQTTQDALAALQRGGELERRASRRFSQYQINKHLGSSMPMLPPTQNSPIPNRGRDVRESINAVRQRGSMLHGRQGSSTRINTGVSPNRKNEVNRISEENSLSSGTTPDIKPPPEPAPYDSPTVKTPEDKLGHSYAELDGGAVPDRGSATLSGPLDAPALPPSAQYEPPKEIPRRSGSRKAAPPSPPLISQQFVPEQSPQPGKELTLFLQYKSKVKKFVLEDGYNDLTIGRLQLAFIEKFNWNTHHNGLDLPDIYLQDPVSGVRHELEDLSDIKDRSVLALNVDALDEVKKHIDDGIAPLRRVIEDVKTGMQDQQVAVQRISEEQQEQAKQIATIAAAPTMPTRLPSPPLVSSFQGSAPSGKATAAQLTEVQSIRRDLAVMRQTYTSFVKEVESSMTSIRTKAKAVKATAADVSIPAPKGDSGRAYVNAGKKTLNEESEKILERVEGVQDAIEDLRKDVVSRGVRPLPRQLEQVGKDISIATAELKKLKDMLKREKPIWTKIWESELQVVCEERDLLSMQEDLAADLEDDLSRAVETFSLVEQATKQQMQNAPAAGQRVPSSGLRHVESGNVDPKRAKDGVLNEIRALEPKTEERLEAIERAQKLRQRELESRRGGEFQKELGAFVEEGRLQKTGGHEEVERMRKAKDERIRREIYERQQARAAGGAPPTTTEPAVDSTVPVEEASEVPVPGEHGINGEEYGAKEGAEIHVQEISEVFEPETPQRLPRSKQSSWFTSIVGRYSGAVGIGNSNGASSAEVD